MGKEQHNEMMRCPMCGVEGPFAVRIYGYFNLGKDGDYDFEHNPGDIVGYFDDDECHCRACGHTDRVCIFKEAYRNGANEEV